MYQNDYDGTINNVRSCGGLGVNSDYFLVWIDSKTKNKTKQEKKVWRYMRNQCNMEPV